MTYAKKPALFWGILLLGAFLLRACGINFGMYHPDEHLIINHALAFGMGDLNPHMFYFPSFFLYLLFFVYALFYAIGNFAHLFHGKDEFLALFLRDPHIFYVLGRLVSVGLGTATVWVIYLLGREYKNERVGRLAAVFLAVNFLHVRDSHFATMDIAFTFFIALSFFCLLKFLNKAERRWYLASVMLAGVAFAVKYNAFLLCVPIALAYLVTTFPVGLRQKGASGAIIALIKEALFSAVLMTAAFFIFSPYAVLDWKSAVGFIGDLYQINRGFNVSWLRHIEMLFYSLDWPLFFLSLIGMCWVKGKKAAVPTLSFFILYYVMITKAGQPFERYVLALIPFCVVWAADALDEIDRWCFHLGKKTNFALIAGFIVILLLPKTLYSDILFLKKDTRDEAREWVERTVPSRTALVLGDSAECPKFTPSKKQVGEKLSRLKTSNSPQPAKTRRLEKLFSLEPYPEPSYNLYYLREHSGSEKYTLQGPFIAYDMGAVKVLGAGYVFICGSSVGQNDFRDALRQASEEPIIFDPRRNKRHPMETEGWTYLPIDGFFWNHRQPGPLIIIYKVENR